MPDKQKKLLEESKARDGDKTAYYGDLLASLNSQLMRVASRKMKIKEDAEDLVGETLLRMAAKDPNEFSHLDVKALQRYAKAVLNNVHLNKLERDFAKKRNNRCRTSSAYDNGFNTDISDKKAIDPSDALIAKETLGLLLNALGDRQKYVLIYTLENYSPKEIADILEVSVQKIGRDMGEIHKKIAYLFPEHDKKSHAETVSRKRLQQHKDGAEIG